MIDKFLMTLLPQIRMQGEKKSSEFGLWIIPKVYIMKLNVLFSFSLIKQEKMSFP